MKIWVDADARPVAVKEILYRAANRTRIELTLIANQMLRVPPSPWIKALQVPAGFDVADQKIAQEVVADDVVVTADVPLAALVIAKGAVVIDPRGELLDKGNIQERLSMRNFMESLCSSGIETGGPASLSSADRQLCQSAGSVVVPRSAKFRRRCVVTVSTCKSKANEIDSYSDKPAQRQPVMPRRGRECRILLRAQPFFFVMTVVDPPRQFAPPFSMFVAGCPVLACF